MCKSSVIHRVPLILIVFVTILNSTHPQSLQLEERLVSYTRCRLDSDCRENSFCFGNDKDTIGTCKCQQGFELLTRNRTYYACLKLASFGEACVQNNQCFDNMGTLAVCDDTCKCGTGSHLYSDAKCYKSVLLTDICRADANCLLQDGSYGYCVDGRCDCLNLLQRPSEDKTRCIESKRIGDSCNSDVECSLISNSLCRLVCRCAVGYVLSRNGRNCIKAATQFFEPCDEDDQCSEFLKGSLCNDKNCTCADGYHGFGSGCVRNVGLNEACIGIEECVPDMQYINIVNCTHGICKCQPGAVSEQFGCNHSTIFLINSYLLLFSFLLIYLNFVNN